MIVAIAEKPEVGREIANTISNQQRKSNGYIECLDLGVTVTWAIGHLLQLAEPEYFDPKFKKWNMDDLPLIWPIEYIPNPETKQQLTTVINLLRKASEVRVAVDADAAGQAIWESIVEYMGGLSPDIPIKRILITDNNLIQKAWDNPKSNTEFWGLYQEEKSRQISDMRLGFSLSRAVTLSAQDKGRKETFAVGRVKSGILGMIALRERSRANHEPQYYQNVGLTLNTECGPISLRHLPSKSAVTDEKGRLINSEEAKLTAIRVTQSNPLITNVTCKTTHQSPPLPFDLLSLQSEASRVLDLKPDRVMEIAQKLKDTYRAITYHRSDSRYLSDEAHEDAPALLNTLAQIEAFEPLINLTEPSIKSRAFNSSKITAHHAIVVTTNISGIDDMSDEEFEVYSLIMRNYVIQFLRQREKEVTTIEVEAAGEIFKGRFERTTYPGWGIVFAKDKDGEIQDEFSTETEMDYSILSTQSSVSVIQCESKDMETKPKASYTMPTLLSDLGHTAKYIEDPELRQALIASNDSEESGSLGTSATRSEIIKDLFKRGYIKEEKKKIYPTQLGYELYDALPVEITSPQTTAVWAQQQLQIRQGRLQLETFVDGVQEVIGNIVEQIKVEGINIESSPKETEALARCPKCHEDSCKQITGKYGKYFRCVSCNEQFDSYKNKPYCAACPKCDSQLRVRKSKPKGKGQRGKIFIGCSNYPACNYSAH